ncbi:MAG TPA: alpha-L-fucosidase, partial [Candidatus Spyradosoma merdigallinarum]|nr:alpha-L-fucosidase [Candidatus Spyradosoma merdigallinarum]
PAFSSGAPKPYGATPTEPQVQWQRLEFYAFTHFGLNTFTGREWGYGDESPTLFNPTDFDAEEIVKTFKEGGMTGMIYTAKHHDGWCAWPTKTTEHSIKKSPWKNGKGDVVKEFSEACKKYGIKFGTYLSPWDRNHPEYGRPGYIKAYYGQIEELLTNYGDVFEIWFDGANGGDGYYGGARERRNTPGGADKYYDFEQIVKNIRKMQPECIIWGASHYGDARWGGSERGHVGYPHWHTIGSSSNAGPAHPPSCRDRCQHAQAAHGVRGGDRWVPAEGDTPINHSGWFWHKGGRPKSPETLMQVWFDCVGRGANLILNLAPDKTGRLDPADVKALMGFKKLRDALYKKDFALGGDAKGRSRGKAFSADKLTDGDLDTFWATKDGQTTAAAVVELPSKATFDVVRVREEIRLGQRVDAWALDAEVDGEWKEVVSGMTIGVQTMLVLPEPVTAKRVRLRITEAAASPCIAELSLFKLPEGLNLKKATNEPLFTQGVPKTKWKIVAEPKGTNAKAAIDGNADTFWHTHPRQELRPPQSFTVDMGETLKLRAFTYLPRQDGTNNGMTDRYKFEISTDGKKWKKVAEGEFGNLRANPIEQTVAFPPQNARYFRFTGTHALEKNHVSAAEIGVLEAK